MKGRWLALGWRIGFAVTTCASLGLAQPANEPPADSSPIRAAKIKKPEPIDTPVAPIAGNWSPAEVVLSLVIDKSGNVASVKLVSGSEPFSGAALRAAPNWKFVPALRDDEPVSSNIHFLVVFEPKQEEAPDDEAPSEDDDTQDVDSKPVAERSVVQASAQAMEEVVVYGKRTDPGSTQISRAEVRNLAGAFDDPLRALEVMPGVTPIVSGLPIFFVRGAPPGNVGFYIDGIRVPLLYHAFLGPSVLHPAFIRNVSLHAGPMPARFGRIAGGAVEAELAEPEGVARAEASLRLIDAGVFAEAPINHGRGYALLGGRYSYTALLISAFSPGQRVDYWDYQALVGHSLGRKNEISLLGLGAFDYAGTDGEVAGGTEFHRADLRWDHHFSRDTDFRLAVTYGRDRTRSSEGYVSDSLVGSRINFEHRSDRFIVRSGGDVWVDKYSMEVDAAVSEPESYFELFPTRTDTSGGAWMDVVLFPQGRVQVIPGVRADVFSSLGTQLYSVDPRLFAQYRLTKNLRAIHGIGISHQSPNFVPSIPGAQVAGLDGGLQRSLHASTKYEADLPWDVSGSIAFFINGTERMTDPIGLTQTFTFDETSAEKRAQGRAAGVEIYIKRPLTRNLGGLLSYTFSKTNRSLDAISTQSGFERTHVVNGALTYNFGYHIQASARVAVASGIPGRRTVPNDFKDGFAFDQSRSFPYIRTDLKLSKRWYVTEHFNWGLNFEVLNATYTPNVTRRNCDPSPCEDIGNAPIIFPLVGAEAHWQ